MAFRRSASLGRGEKTDPLEVWQRVEDFEPAEAVIPLTREARREVARFQEEGSTGLTQADRAQTARHLTN